MESKTPQQLYFVAILPPKRIYTKIRELQYEIKKKYGCKQALRPPVHITLQVPFKRPESQESQIIQQLENFAAQRSPFTITINGFGTFEPHTIFVKPEKTDELMNLQSELIDYLQTELSFTDKEIVYTHFNPHFTIAYRDLKPKYQEVWSNFKNRGYTDRFEVEEICLLKHNYRFWEIVRYLPLKG